MATSVHRHECFVVIARIVRLARPLLDHDSLGAAALPGHLRIDVVLPVLASREAMLSISECSPPDVPWRWLAVPFLDLGKNIQRLLRHLGVERNSRSRARRESPTMDRQP